MKTKEKKIAALGRRVSQPDMCMFVMKSVTGPSAFFLRVQIMDLFNVVIEKSFVENCQKRVLPTTCIW